MHERNVENDDPWMYDDGVDISRSVQQRKMTISAPDDSNKRMRIDSIDMEDWPPLTSVDTSH